MCEVFLKMLCVLNVSNACRRLQCVCRALSYPTLEVVLKVQLLKCVSTNFRNCTAAAAAAAAAAS
jgi:hypothetical protein